MSTFKKLCKLIKPGEFSKLIDEIDDVFHLNKLNITKKFNISKILNNKQNEMKKRYLIIQKKFKELKNEKNCNNNSNSNNKKLRAVELLLEILKLKIDYKENIEDKNIKDKKELRDKLKNIKDKINDFNITIDSIDKSKQILDREINSLNDKLDTNIEAVKVLNNLKNKNKNSNTISNLKRRLKQLTEGGKRKTRKLKH
jgi:chromosome segregation ATPase